MRKVLVIANREYQAAVRSKAFLISLLAMPVFMFGSIVVHTVLRDKTDVSDKRIGVVDTTGRLVETLQQAAAARNDPDNPGGIFGGAASQIMPKFLIEPVSAEGQDFEQIKFDLSERVRNQELFGFVLIEDAVLAAEPEKRVDVVYHSNSPTYPDVPRWLGAVISDRVRTIRLEQLGIDPGPVLEATVPVNVDHRALVTRDDQGDIVGGERANEIVAILVPAAAMMLMFMMIMIGAPPLVNSVLEEKIQRIAEVLLSSARPFELMMGKLVGMAGVSLTMLVIYVGGVAFVAYRTGYGQYLPVDLIGWFALFQVMAIFMFGSLFSAVGAAVTDLKEAQSMVAPIMMIVVAPLFIWFQVIREPNAPLSVALSLIPTATPMLMLLRMAAPESIPMWQPVLGMGLVLLTTIFCVFVGGRIFRVGILMQGKGAKISELMKWVIRG